MDDLTDRKKEKMAMAFLAVGDVKTPQGWKKIKDSNSSYSVTTREIIKYMNENFEENMSLGSYDDIRRQDLSMLTLADIVVRSKPNANMSNPTRGYKINSIYSRIIRNYGQSDWFKQVETFNKMHPTYKDRMSQKRDFPKIYVRTPNGEIVTLKDGEHNAIQKQIIEEFLPRFGFHSTLLYCGDADNKYDVIYEKEKMEELGLKDLEEGALPDIIAYSEEKDWFYLIEAYHTSNPITPQRKEHLKKIMRECAEKVVYVTAFENSSDFRKCPEDLAWETEVWIATDPDHMIHLDGHRFMGPYSDDDN